MRFGLFATLLALGCTTQEYAACDDMCTELVRECSFDAFPTTESCMTGCADEMANGSDVEGKKECILDADCDTFAIIECQNNYGSDS